MIFNSFSYFSLANKNGGANPLPITLLSFNAEPNKKAVDLSWTTATESNNSFFTVERSADAANFDSITMVTGAGSSSTLKDYSAIDFRPLAGL